MSNEKGDFQFNKKAVRVCIFLRENEIGIGTSWGFLYAVPDLAPNTGGLLMAKNEIRNTNNLSMCTSKKELFYKFEETRDLIVSNPIAKLIYEGNINDGGGVFD